MICSVVEADKPEPELVVIIPTLGRPSLVDVIRQISFVEENQVRIIIIPDGALATEEVKKSGLESFPNVFVIENYEKKGPAACINMGLDKISSPCFFCIFSDDDVWLGSRRMILREIGAKANEEVMFFGAHSFGDITKIHSRIGELDIDPIEYVYDKCLGRNKNYLSVTTGIFPYSARLIKFRTHLNLREDLTWLHDLYVSGVRLAFIDFHLANIQKNYLNTLSRETWDQIQIFKKFIHEETSLHLNTFAIYHAGRSAVMEGYPKKYWRCIHEYKDHSRKFSAREIFIAFLYLILASIKFFSKQTKRTWERVF